MSDALVAAALGELVPEPQDAFGDWADVLRRAGIGLAATAAPVAAPRRRPRRLLVAFAFVALLLVVLFATPAFGLLRDLIGRTNVPFTGKTAPLEVKRNFFDMSAIAPPALSPQAIASQTRKVGVFHARGKAHALYVAPTRKGGYCWIFADDFGGCREPQDARHRGAAQPGEVRPGLLAVTWNGGPLYTQEVGGTIAAPAVQTLLAEYEDGTSQPLPFVWVSKPINAGFFLLGVAPAHERAGARLVAVAAKGKNGRVLSRVTFSYARTAPPPRQPQPAPTAGPPLPAPTAPFQRGSANGVSVEVGANRVALFDTRGAAPAVKPLLARASYACFKYTRYHEDVPFELGFAPQTIRGGAIPLNGVAPPYDGCELEAAYGRTWPDRFHSHAAVEIAFTARARRFFADRAAARDIALFVRTRRHHGLAGIRAVAQTSAPLPPDTIGYVRTGTETTYVERSTTGRRFTIVVRADRVVRQNVRPLASVF